MVKQSDQGWQCANNVWLIQPFPVEAQKERNQTKQNKTKPAFIYMALNAVTFMKRTCIIIPVAHGETETHSAFPGAAGILFC